jgi:hypothetical protein
MADIHLNGLLDDNGTRNFHNEVNGVVHNSFHLVHLGGITYCH